jgi:hypothetical protein
MVCVIDLIAGSLALYAHVEQVARTAVASWYTGRTPTTNPTTVLNAND